MPCNDCFALRQEFIAQKDFMSQWFDAFMKQFQSLEFQTLNLRQSMEGLTSEFRSEVSSKLQEFDVALYNQSAQIKSLQTCFKTVGNGPGRPSATCLVGMGGEIGLEMEFQQPTNGTEIRTRHGNGRPKLYKNETEEEKEARKKRLSHARSQRDKVRNECKVCKKTFVRKNYLKMHELTHSGKKPFECPQCNQTFLQRGDLRKHIRLHTGSRPYKCPICDRRFTQSSNLASHKRIHSDEKPIACAEPGCTYRCKKKQELSQHSIVHSTEKPFQCEKCGRAFARKWVFMGHQKRVKCWEKKKSAIEEEAEETGVGEMAKGGELENRGSAELENGEAN